MALVEAARAPASAKAESWNWTDAFLEHPALWLLQSRINLME